jgi:hypothetical protein
MAPAENLVKGAVANVAGRVVKVTRYGETERNRRTGERVEERRALKRQTEQSAVTQTMQQYWQLPPGQQTIRTKEILAKRLARELYPRERGKQREANEKRLTGRLTLSMQRGKADTLGGPVISASSNEEKVAIIYGARADFTPGDLERWMREAARQKIISPQVIVDVHKKMRGQRVTVH